MVSEHAQHYTKVAADFDRRAGAVPAGAWENPAPCDGWVARDIVRHLVEWVPGFFSSFASLDLGEMPSVDEDPVAAWRALDHALRAALDDPEVALMEFEMRGTRYTVERAIDQFVSGDLVVHAWDLARATGLDERLDPEEVHAMLVEMEPLDEMLRQSGHYGPKIPVPDDADEQTRLIAFTGRQP